ncbi:XPP3 aminopeptidase, partial [Polypterus senegalus]
MSIELITIDQRTVTYRVVSMPGDGAYVFHSLCYILHGHIRLTLDIRRNIVSYVLNDWDRFKVWTDDGTGDNYTTQEHYKSEMLKPFTYASACEVTPGLSQTEYELRRHRLMSLVAAQTQGSSSTDNAVVLLSHPTVYMTNDIPFPFHQNTDFLYLSGCLEEDCALVLKSVPGVALPAHKALLFVPRRDPTRELWDGPRSGTDGAVALTGVDDAYPIDELARFVQNTKDEGCTLWYDYNHVSHPRLHHDVMLSLVEAKNKTSNRVRPVRSLVHSLRVIKSPAEIEIMKNAGKITAQFDYECRIHGANFLAYPPVIAGGNRSNTLHYVSNNQMLKDDEMVLLDGGCELSGYVSDITRTWPVNGRFSLPQAELYQAVLDVQKACLGLCSPGVSLDNIYSLMQTLIGQKLKELGIVGKKSKDHDIYRAARQYCPHHVGHYLGMDVHDTPEVSRSQTLRPGMVITIEPGIYIPEDDGSSPARYQGLGVRIEDDVVITESGPPLVLSCDAPKEIQDIESICQ